MFYLVFSIIIEGQSIAMEINSWHVDGHFFVIYYCLIGVCGQISGACVQNMEDFYRISKNDLANRNLRQFFKRNILVQSVINLI